MCTTPAQVAARCPFSAPPSPPPSPPTYPPPPPLLPAASALPLQCTPCRLLLLCVPQHYFGNLLIFKSQPINTPRPCPPRPKNILKSRKMKIESAIIMLHYSVVKQENSSEISPPPPPSNMSILWRQRQHACHRPLLPNSKQRLSPTLLRSVLSQLFSTN
jgi:hypothetical protein